MNFLASYLSIPFSLLCNIPLPDCISPLSSLPNRGPYLPKSKREVVIGNENLMTAAEKVQMLLA